MVFYVHYQVWQDQPEIRILMGRSLVRSLLNDWVYPRASFLLVRALHDRNATFVVASRVQY